MDLEHSFGPAYIRGRLLRGTAAEAVIGVSQAESAATIDGILTLGILWLDYCPPEGRSTPAFRGAQGRCARGSLADHCGAHGMAQTSAADFSSIHSTERSEELEPIDFRDSGNQTARLVHCFLARSGARAIARPVSTESSNFCRPARDRASRSVPASAAEVALLLHGLEFARVRHSASPSLLCHAAGDHLRRRSIRDAADGRNRGSLPRTLRAPLSKPSSRGNAQGRALSHAAGALA